MQIAQTVNLQVIVPNAANVNLPSQTAQAEGESFSDALNSITAVESVNDCVDVEKALSREIAELVQKILCGKIRPESVPKKFMAFGAVKDAIKTVMKLMGKTEDEIDRLILDNVVTSEVKSKTDDTASETFELKSGQADEASGESGEPAEKTEEMNTHRYYSSGVAMNLTYCTEELAAVARVEAVQQVQSADVNAVSDETLKAPNENTEIPIFITEAPITADNRQEMPKQAAVPDMNTEKPLDNSLPNEADAKTDTAVREAHIPQEIVGEAAAQVSQTKSEITIENGNDAGKENTAEIAKTAPVAAVQQPTMTRQDNNGGDSSDSTDLTRGNAAENLLKNSESGVKSDFEIKRFEAVTKPAMVSESSQKDAPQGFVQGTVKPQIVRSTEIHELNVTKQTASKEAPQKPETQQPEMPQLTEESQMQQTQTVKLKIDGKEIEIKPSEVLKQVTQSITQRVNSTSTRDEYVVELEPAQLGKITIRLIKESGKLSVAITAENKQTEALLADKGQFIREAVKENGVQLESWQVVSQSKQEHMAQDYNGSSKNPYYREENQKNADDDESESFSELLASM